MFWKTQNLGESLMAEEKLKTGNHYVHIMYAQKEAKIKLAQ